MTEQEFYAVPPYLPEKNQPTRTIEEWADYISSEHYVRNPDVYSHRGIVVSFFSNPNLRGFWLELTHGDVRQRACVSTRYMAREKYMAIEDVARLSVDVDAPIVIEGVLGYDWLGAQITQVERVWLGDEGGKLFRLYQRKDERHE